MLGRIRRYLDLYDGPLAKFDGFCHWLDRWHLIPQPLLKRICDRFEARLGEPPDEFEEFDTTEAEFDAMAAASQTVAVGGASEVMRRTMGVDDFYVEDEPLADVLAAFDRGEKGFTAMPEHVRRQWAEDWGSPADSVYDKE